MENEEKKSVSPGTVLLWVAALAIGGFFAYRYVKKKIELSNKMKAVRASGKKEPLEPEVESLVNGQGDANTN